VLSRASTNFAEDGCTQLAAGISYFALFSLFPLTLLAVSLFGIVLRDEGTQLRVLDWIVGVLPVEAPALESSLRAVAGGGPTLTIVSLVAAVWSAGALSSALRRSLNIVFDVKRRRPFVQRKLIDFAVLPALGLVALASVVLTTTWRIIRAEAGDRLPLGEELGPLWELGALSIGGLLSFVTFVALYRVLPNRPVRFAHVWPGALVAAIAFEAVKFGFAIYLANFSNYDVVYGSLGGVIALLFWVYLTANIMLFGAEVTAEVPHVLREEPRHGHAGSDEGNWRASMWALARGLVLTPGDSGAAPPDHDRAAGHATGHLGGQPPALAADGDGVPSAGARQGDAR
jgi:membrane protein